MMCGIKTFILCDSKTGYVCNADEVYAGKRSGDNLIPLVMIGNLFVSKVAYQQTRSLYCTPRDSEHLSS